MVYGLRLTCWNAHSAQAQTPFPMVGVQILELWWVHFLVNHSLSLSLRLYFRLHPFSMSVPFSSHILLIWFCFTRPENISSDVLYPVDSSSYTSWDGIAYDVPCTISGAAALENDQVYSCPDGFVPPHDDSDPRNCIKVVSSPHSISFQTYLCSFPHARAAVSFPRIHHYCSQPCPVNAYTTEEYTVMWLVTAVVSTVGLILNVYMAATW